MFAMLQRAATETSTTDTTAVDGVEASAESTSAGTQLLNNEDDEDENATETEATATNLSISSSTTDL